MNIKSIAWLSRLFRSLGWLSVLSVAVWIVLVICQEGANPDTPWIGRLTNSPHHFSAQVSLAIFFKQLAETYFLFLISSLFSMIANPESVSDAKRFLLPTVLAFYAQGILELFGWAMATVSQFNRPVDFGTWNGLAMTVPLSLVGLSKCLIPVFYGITIYVLSRHYSKLVQFESEVV